MAYTRKPKLELTRNTNAVSSSVPASDPAVLSWKPIPGIQTYKVQLDDDGRIEGDLTVTKLAGRAPDGAQVRGPGDRHRVARDASDGAFPRDERRGSPLERPRARCS